MDHEDTSGASGGPQPQWMVRGRDERSVQLFEVIAAPTAEDAESIALERGFAAVFEVTPATPPDAELDQWQRYTNWQFVRLHQRIDNVMRMLIAIVIILLLPIILPIIWLVIGLAP